MNPLSVGIDIGGTKIAIGLISACGEIRTEATFPTDSAAGIPDACERITRTIEQLVSSQSEASPQILGIGIGCPGPMNRETGEILNPHTLPGWEDQSLTACLEQNADYPVYLENDADAALLGECVAGAGQGAMHVVMLTFGTGVGGAALSGGKILRGLEGEHPEIGLIPVMYDQTTDYSGVPGSLESLASGTGIGNAGAQHGFPDSRAVFTAAASGHAAAKTIVDRAIHATSLAGLSLAHTLCPERILLGGGLMDSHYEDFAQPMQTALDQAVLLPRGKIQVKHAQLGNRAGMVGAASLVFEKQYNRPLT